MQKLTNIKFIIPSTNTDDHFSQFISVRRPISIPSSVKLIYIIKSDPLNRFVLQGEGNVAKVRFNMQTDPDQESLWVAKWRDDIASFLTKQQWSSPSIGTCQLCCNHVTQFFSDHLIQYLFLIHLFLT